MRSAASVQLATCSSALCWAGAGAAREEGTLAEAEGRSAGCQAGCILGFKRNSGLPLPQSIVTEVARQRLSCSIALREEYSVECREDLGILFGYL